MFCEFGVVEYELEEVPVFGAEGGFLEESGSRGGAELRKHALVEFAGGGSGEATEVPEVVAEFGAHDGRAELGSELVLLEELFDARVFAGSAFDFAGAIAGGGGVVDAVIEEGISREDDALGEGKSLDIEAEVLVRGAGGREELDRIFKEEFAAINGGPDGRGELEEEVVAARVEDFASVFGRDDGVFAAGFAFEEIIIGFDNVGVMPGGELVEVLESVDVEIIVRLEDADVFTPGALDSLVHAVAIARIGLIDDDDARVFLSEFLDDGVRIVGGAVVDADDFDVGESLVDEASERLTQIIGGVVDRDEDGELGHYSASTSTLASLGAEVGAGLALTKMRNLPKM